MSQGSGSSHEPPARARRGAGGGGAPPATVYLAVGLPPGALPDRLADIQLSIAASARKVTESGHPVHYLNAMYLPARTRLLCVFAAESEEAVRAVMKLVGLPFTEIRAGADSWDPRVAEDRRDERERDI